MGNLYRPGLLKQGHQANHHGCACAQFLEEDSPESMMRLPVRRPQKDGIIDSSTPRPNISSLSCPLKPIQCRRLASLPPRGSDRSHFGSFLLIFLLLEFRADGNLGVFKFRT